MAMSDCARCWETPCVCGKEYEKWSIDRLIQLRDTLQKEINKRNTNKRVAIYSV